MTQKVFLLGVGCQKGGTTWLHAHLAAHPQCDMGMYKEYHALDVHFMPNAEYSIQLRRQTIDALIAATARIEAEHPKMDPGLHRRLSAQARRMEFFSDLKSYATYFAHISTRAGVRLVGDITPAYSMLEARHFATVRQLLEERGLRVKVVFLMRDPIDRIYSMCRMVAKNKGAADTNGRITPATLFERDHAKDHIALRTRYDRTIRQLEQAFPAEDILYEFYESMFEETRIRRISDFLGIDHARPRLDKVINESPAGDGLSPHVVKAALREYVDVYRFCEQKFGRDLIHSLWPHAELLSDLQ